MLFFLFLLIFFEDGYCGKWRWWRWLKTRIRKWKGGREREQLLNGEKEGKPKNEFAMQVFSSSLRPSLFLLPPFLPKSAKICNKFSFSSFFLLLAKRRI